MRADEARRTRAQRWWPFVLLCVLAAARWMALDLAPAFASTLLSLGIACGSAALGAGTWASVRRETNGVSVRCLLESFVAGALLLAGPYTALVLHARMVEVTSFTVAMALVPVVVAVARPAFRETEGAELAGRMWPGIAAAAGFLLVLPEPALASWREDLVLTVAPVLTGLGAAWLRTRRGAELPRAAAALSGAAVVFLVGAAVHGGLKARVLPAAAVDVVVVALSVTALCRLGATRWSAQFEIVPLVVLLEGLLGLGFRPDARAVVGLVLVVLSSVFLLLPPHEEPVEELVPRG